MTDLIHVSEVVISLKGIGHDWLRYIFQKASYYWFIKSCSEILPVKLIFSGKYRKQFFQSLANAIWCPKRIYRVYFFSLVHVNDISPAPSYLVFFYISMTQTFCVFFQNDSFAEIDWQLVFFQLFVNGLGSRQSIHFDENKTKIILFPSKRVSLVSNVKTKAYSRVNILIKKSKGLTAALHRILCKSLNQIQFLNRLTQYSVKS